jgi:hypothetical protein
MSALGHKRTLLPQFGMSAFLPKADIAELEEHVRFVPKADIVQPRSNSAMRFRASANASSLVLH